jgi:hypothetical protein
MKIHIGKLLDRYAVGRVHYMDVQTDCGQCVRLKVEPEDIEQARQHWGGSWVHYRYRGAKAYYVTPAEVEQIDAESEGE